QQWSFRACDRMTTSTPAVILIAGAMVTGRSGVQPTFVSLRQLHRKGTIMASEAIRDPKADHLLTPQNSAFIIIDYQPVQVNSIASMDRQLLINNIVGASKAAVAYELPIIHSTVNVKTGLNKPPIPQIQKVLKSYPTIDRTTINSWEDVEFKQAVVAT